MHTIALTVRFCETDALGHINNTSYFIYLEEGRVKFFESLGLGISTEDWNFILASTTCDFKAQGYFNDRLSVHTSVSTVGNKSFVLTHEIKRTETGELIAKGSATLVYFDFKKQTTESIPDDVRTVLAQHGERKPVESES
ncbi:acyl-CoA thioesterase [Fictibacillus fluitans]|uniref:Thioesterase family protein n=1 Tax=Fictibacillus fluitans TaxID=3058422 RepID=A0ABT8HRD3_9BACL|nr:thioesterase family protein [Fictibacillus sp. NE201]MDN4523085.1 thioesterase family protein [Fictibacillus sp. NE201]